MKLRVLAIPVFAAYLSGVWSHAWAETPQEKGRAVFDEMDKRNRGYGDSTGTLQMILKDRKGEAMTRDMQVKSLEGPADDGDKTLMVFESPKDQRGTALLTYQHKQRDNDQWLYLPALKRVKKIAAQTKSGPFMGSEFSFEDVGGQQVDNYTYVWLRDEAVDGQDCFVVESHPKDENSGYTRIVTWIDKKNYRSLKGEFYDRKDTLLKTLTASDYHLYLDKFWRAGKVEMVNAQTGKSTEMVTTRLEFKTGLREDDFSQNSLQRAR